MIEITVFDYERDSVSECLESKGIEYTVDIASTMQDIITVSGDSELVFRLHYPSDNDFIRDIRWHLWWFHDGRKLYQGHNQALSRCFTCYHGYPLWFS